jgi:hypothetical protein
MDTGAKPHASTTATDTHKAVPIPIPHSAEKESTHVTSSSPATSSSPLTTPPETTGISVKDKIANLKAASSTTPSNDPPPERRKSDGGSKIAALASAVNVAALGPRGVMPVKRPSVTESMVTETTHESTHSAPKENEIMKTENTHATPSNSTVPEEKHAEVVEEKAKRPQSTRIAALGGLVNVAALGPRPVGVPKPTAQTEAVDEHSVPVTHSHPPSLPAVREEDEAESGKETPATTEAVPAPENTASIESGDKSVDPATNGAPKAEGEEDEPEVFADPTIMYSKRVSAAWIDHVHLP